VLIQTVLIDTNATLQSVPCCTQFTHAWFARWNSQHS